MKKLFNNIINFYALADKAGVKYARINQAVKFENASRLTDEEREAIIKASADTHEELIKFLKG